MFTLDCMNSNTVYDRLYELQQYLNVYTELYELQQHLQC